MNNVFQIVKNSLKMCKYYIKISKYHISNITKYFFGEISFFHNGVIMNKIFIRLKCKCKSPFAYIHSVKSIR